MRKTYSMNAGWRFHLGEIAQRNFGSIHASRFAAPEWMKAGNHALSKADYPDHDWRVVNLPHDYVVEGEFTSEANAVHGSLPVDVAWYRKVFDFAEFEKGRSRIHLEFDGIYRDAHIWLNGHFVGRHLSGYTSFSFDITEMVAWDSSNCLAIRCDARDFELWSYEGGGIYRDVRLVVSSPIFIPYSGIQVVSKIPHQSKPASAKIEISTNVVNTTAKSLSYEVEHLIVNTHDDSEVLSKVSQFDAAASGSSDCLCLLTLADPLLWEPAHPHLYLLKTIIRMDGVEVDRVEKRFGIRSLRFDPQQGFSINGLKMKLKGVCDHQDHAGVGIAIPPALYRWRLERLLEMGINALRTAHNPPSPVLLDLCDELGILVIDEHRLPGTSPEMLSQLEALIRRDRNHPCVILWSLGNEEMAIQETNVGPRILRVMQDLAHRLDPTRLCTYGSNCDFNEIARNFVENGFITDVFGANYTSRNRADGTATAEAERYDEFHERFPGIPLLGTETGGSSATRGLYGVEYYKGQPHKTLADATPVETNPKREGSSCAYNETLTHWGRTIEDTWRDCATRDFLAGTFLWTGFDYRGETFPYGWPAVVCRYGLMDLCGFPKDSFFYYQSQWISKPVLHLFPHWNWQGREGELIDVWAYTNCPRVELFLNDVALGEQTIEPFAKASWQVHYESGRLKAIGYDLDGQIVSTCEVKTTGEASAVRMRADRKDLQADGVDLAVIRVEVVDEQGIVVPVADNLITFNVQGPGRILGVGNGNPISHEPEQANYRRVYHGLAQLIISAKSDPGEIIITAESSGLAADQIRIKTITPLNEPVSIQAVTPLLANNKTETINRVDGAL